MSAPKITHFGNAGHLCVADWCRFHLCTLVECGNRRVLVSTVGEYLPTECLWDFNAEQKGVRLNGRGDERRYQYMRDVGYEQIGMGRKFETMVFRAGQLCPCGCGLRQIDGSELDFEGYNDAKSANEGHAAMVDKWSKGETE